MSVDMPEERTSIVLVISRGFPTSWADEIINEYKHAKFQTPNDGLQSIQNAIVGAHALINCPRPLYDDNLIDLSGGTLRWIHIGGAGVEEFLTPRLVSSDITLTNGRIIQGPEVADHALALILALTRNIHHVLRGQPATNPRPIELRGKSAVVVGVGGIGMLIAERLRGFGVQVTGVDENYTPMMGSLQDVITPDHFFDVLPFADLVVCAAPSTHKSRKMFNKTAFSLMKKTAFFVNVSRGALVDTEAMTQCLLNDGLSGIGLDVSDPEPLPSNHPLQNDARVVITPHIAGLSEHNRDRSKALAKKNIGRFLRNEPLFNVVNKTQGF
jgi:phosphoglycerate dehydrogenase-like enzyme